MMSEWKAVTKSFHENPGQPMVTEGTVKFEMHILRLPPA